MEAIRKGNAVFGLSLPNYCRRNLYRFLKKLHFQEKIDAEAGEDATPDMFA